MICPAIIPFKTRKYVRKITKQERVQHHMLLFFLINCKKLYRAQQ